MRKKNNLLSRLISFVVGVVVFFGSGYGQYYQTFNEELNNIYNTARWRVGPVKIVPTLQFSNIGYDNNVYYQSNDSNPISDLTATVSFRADAYLIFRNWLIFNFSENPSYIYFAEQKDERYLNNSYSFRLRLLAFSRIALSGASQKTKMETRWTGEISARVIESRRETSGSVFYETPRNTCFGFTGLIRRYQYEDLTIPGGVDSISVSHNREEREGTFEFYYQIFSDSVFFINAGYAEYNFDFLQAHFRESYSYQSSIGVRFPLLGRARGTLSLGYKNLVPRRTLLSSFSGIAGNTDVNFRFGRFSYRFNYTRDIPFSVLPNSIFFVSNRYGAGVSFYLSRSIRLDYYFRRGQNYYQEPVKINPPNEIEEEIQRKDIFMVHTGAIVVRIFKNTGVGIEGNYWDRKSNYAGASLSRLFVGTFLTYEF